VKVEIIRYVDHAQPGWVECVLRDAHGNSWSFIEKVPVVTDKLLEAESIYPQPGVLTCELICYEENFALISTIKPWGIESVNGETTFKVSRDLLVDQPPK
jgi:hypothetical protein